MQLQIDYDVSLPVTKYYENVQITELALTNDEEFDDEETCKQSVNKNIDQKLLIDEMVDNKQVKYVLFDLWYS